MLEHTEQLESRQEAAVVPGAFGGDQQAPARMNRNWRLLMINRLPIT
jgi:hypothetical protein